MNNLMLFAIADAGEESEAMAGLEDYAAHLAMPAAGSVVALNGALQLPLTAGSIELRATVNGTPTGPVLSLTPALQSELLHIPAGTVPFDAGDSVGVRVVTGADAEAGIHFPAGSPEGGVPRTTLRLVAVPWLAFAE